MSSRNDRLCNTARLERIAAETTLNLLTSQVNQRLQQFVRQPPPPPPPHDYREYYYDAVYQDRGFDGILPFLLMVFATLFKLILLLTISAATYGIFYHAAMPARAATEPLYFDYTTTTAKRHPHTETTSVSSWYSMAGEGPSSWYSSMTIPDASRRHLHQPPVSSVEPLPKASVDLFAKYPAWEAVHESVLPAPVAQDRLLSEGRAYYLEIVLTLPETAVNVEAGIFGVVTDLLSSNGTCLAISRRSSRFPHQSAWITLLKKWLTLIPLLLGAIEESRTVVIPAYRHFVESTDYPLQHVVVKIERPSSAQNLVEVIRGELRIGNELTRFQEILKEWFYTCFCIGTLLFASIYYVMGLLLAFAWKIYDARRRDALFEEEPYCELDLDDEDFQFEDSRQYDVDESGEEEVEEGVHEDMPSFDINRGAQRDSGREGEWEDLVPPAEQTSPDEEPATPRVTVIHDTPESHPEEGVRNAWGEPFQEPEGPLMDSVSTIGTRTATPAEEHKGLFSFVAEAAESGGAFVHGILHRR